MYKIRGIGSGNVYHAEVDVKEFFAYKWLFLSDVDACAFRKKWTVSKICIVIIIMTTVFFIGLQYRNKKKYMK